MQQTANCKNKTQKKQQKKKKEAKPTSEQIERKMER
jgi:hypothetical protein